MRLFVALDLSEAAGAGISSMIADLKTIGADARWVRPAAMHLTLKFLGETEGSRVSSVKNCLDGLGPSTTPFDFRFSGTGAFPDFRRPEVLWAGVSEGSGAMGALAGRIEESLAALGFSRTAKAFQAHLTLARLRSQKNAGLLWEKTAGLDFAALGPVRADHLSLYRSVLFPNGSVYELIHRVNFSAV